MEITRESLPARYREFSDEALAAAAGDGSLRVLLSETGAMLSGWARPAPCVSCWWCSGFSA